jgi:ABC-2 type transport system permease protein
MKIVLTMIKYNFKIMVFYRYVFLITFMIDPILLLINIALFTAIFSYNNTNIILSYSLTQMIWYFAATNFIWNFIWNRTDENIAKGILTGDLAMQLIRPVSIFKSEFANAFATRIAGILFEFIPSMIIYSLLCFPSFLTVPAFLKFLTSVVLSFVMNFLISFLIGLSSFFIKSSFSLQALKSIFISLTAGAYIPYEFLPDWLRNFFQLLPFQYLFYWPIQFFLNKEITQDYTFFLQIIASQIAWIIILYICARVFWKLAAKRFCSAGG